MTDHALRCANCGDPLERPDAICLRCEPEFLPENADLNTGKYRCPSCGCRFDSAVLALWPPNAKWYVPQKFKPKCPHCGKFLRDRQIPERTLVEIGIIILIATTPLFLPWVLAIQCVLLVVLLATDFVRTRRARSAIAREEERYAVARDA